jgi:mevalonate kinase
MSVGTAPGKVILFGEHAVVYGRPAIAVPLHDRCATARVEPGALGSGIILRAEDLGCQYPLATASAEDALALIVRLTLGVLEIAPDQDLVVAVRSTIPIASGLGSGAAVSAAMARALAAHFGAGLTPHQVSELVFQTEVLHHGTPSGVDNTVVAFQQPVRFVKGQPPERFRVGSPLRLVIGVTGVPSPTKVAVAEVRRRWTAERERYETLFDAIGRVSNEGRQAIEGGQVATLGPLMDHNQELLRQIGVSSAELERLIVAAKEAGARGAKLSGAGRGGNMIALAAQAAEGRVAAALKEAGAREVIVTRVDRRSLAINS